MKSDVTPVMNRQQASKIQAIEAEFGEPFWAVLRGFADMGYSKTDTARIIGYHAVAFLRLIKSRQDIPWLPPSQTRGRQEYVRTDAWRDAIRAAKQKAALRYFVRGQWRTMAEIGRLAGIGVTGVHERLRRGWSGDRLAEPPVPRALAALRAMAKRKSAA